MRAGAPLIGVLNAGSSSLKFAFYEDEQRLLSGHADTSAGRAAITATGGHGAAVAPPDLAGAPSPGTLLPALLAWAQERLGGRKPAALGHRMAGRRIQSRRG